MSIRIQNLLRRYDSAKSVGMTWGNLFEDIYDLFMPNRNIAKQSAAGERHNIHLYDSTGALAVRSFVSQLHTGLTPPGTKWIELAPGSEVNPAERNELQKKLTEISDIIFRYVSNSNFDLAINEAFYDLAVGTGALVVNEGPDDDLLQFSSVPLLRIYPEEGIRGDIETVWRDFKKFPARNIKRTWPDAKLNSSLETRLEQEPNAEVELIEGTIFNPKMQAWDYVVIELSTNDAIVDKKLKSSPWIVFRGFKRADEVYGRGPADEALPTMATLNAVIRDELKAAGLKANPIFMGASDGIFNPWTVKLEPWSVIPMNPTSIGQMPIAPIPMAGDPNYQQVEIQSLRDQINKIFFTDPLGPIRQGAQQLTATEIMLRNQEQLEQKVPFIGRLQFELLDKLTERIVYILTKRGVIENVKIDGKRITTKYKSPIVQSQGLANVNRLVQMVQTLQSAFGPQLSILGLNTNEFPEYLAANLDVDPKLIKSKTELEALSRQANVAAQQQPQLPTPPTGGLPGQ